MERFRGDWKRETRTPPRRIRCRGGVLIKFLSLQGGILSGFLLFARVQLFDQRRSQRRVFYRVIQGSVVPVGDEEHVLGPGADGGDLGVMHLYPAFHEC